MRVDLKDTKLMSDVLQAYSISISPDNLNGFTIDSRLVQEGDIYLPIKGEHFDGHQFINSALQSGASIVFSEDSSIDPDSKITYVKSTLNTLAKLATDYRTQINTTVIGITGTNGKTTNKDLLYHILSPSFSTMKTEGNFNSTIGLPITMFTIPENIDYCILEMGASEPGEIQTLCDIALPNMGLITNISEAHISQFETIEEIVETKSALFKSLPADGIAFVNKNDNLINTIQHSSQSVSFGFSKSNNFNAEYVSNNGGKSLKINNRLLQLDYFDTTFAKNILAIYSIASTLGVSHEEIESRLQSFSLPQGRGVVHEIRNIKFIDDSYNANLQSAIAGIENIIQSKINGKRIVVLGDMLELGSLEIEHHKLLGEFISDTNIDMVFTYGTLTNFTFDSISNTSIIKYHFAEKTRLIHELQSVVNSGDLVYLKGSRRMQMEEVITQGFNHHAV
jgi:UDP-N-acetylmuramoyl-tripeptide--D-alanyl-D-alanine ligase